MIWLAWVLLVAALPAAIDALLRLVLTVASRRWRFVAAPGQAHRRWIVLVPARGEGRAVEPTLRSLTETSTGHDVRVILVLDGDDPAAADVARSLQVETVVKPTPGPSKASVLRWAAENLGEALAACDAVMLLDVGSRAAPGFFDAFAWPAGADAVQAFLRGAGARVGAAAALSERVAQRREDQGRQVVGWRVRLRGTGVVMGPDLFLRTVPRLCSTVEDLEISLLLAADGRTLCLAPRDAVVEDEKPETVAGAARQRTRWFVGRFTLLWLQTGALLRLVARRPLEGLAFVVELFSRPLTLTVPLRFLAAGALVLTARDLAGIPAMLAAAVALTACADVAWAASGNGFRPGAVARLVAAWVGALVLLPRALAGWLRVRQPRP